VVCVVTCVREIVTVARGTKKRSVEDEYVKREPVEKARGMNASKEKYSRRDRERERMLKSATWIGPRFQEQGRKGPELRLRRG